MIRLAVCILIIGLLLPGSMQAASLEYFAQGHWVYDSLGRLEQVLRDKQPQPTLVKDEFITRYEAALALAGFLRRLHEPSLADTAAIQRFGVAQTLNLEETVAAYNDAEQTSRLFDEQHTAALRRLAEELALELEVVGYIVVSEQAETADQTAVEPAFDLPDLVAELWPGSENVSAASSSRSLPLWPAYELLGGSSSGSSIFVESLAGREGGSFSLEPQISEPEPDDKVSTVYSSSLPVSSDLLLGARYLELDPSSADTAADSGAASVSGRYQLSPDIAVEGLVFHNTTASTGTGALQLGATVQLGDVELGGSYWSAEPTFQPLEDPSIPSTPSGYEVSLRFGEFFLSTVESRFAEEDITKTSIDLSYGLPNSITVRAGYSQLDPAWKTLAQLGRPSSTSLGLDIPISQGHVRLGVTQEWAPVSQEDPAAVSPSSPSESGSDWIDALNRRSATVGLEYQLDDTTSVQLNYQLIDFSDLDQKSNLTTAEFSITF